MEKHALILSLLCWACAGVAQTVDPLQSRKGEVVVLYADQDFEKETLAWGFWPGGSGTRMELDRDIVQHGRQSLRMTAVSGQDRGFALGGIGTVEPGELYRITVHVRRDLSVPASALSFFLNFREGPDAPIKQRQYPTAVQREDLGEWERWSGFFCPPPAAHEAQLLLGVEHTVGRVWWDNIVIERLGPPGRIATDVWSNLTIGVEVGAPPLKRFNRHRTENTAVYQMAMRFNDLMWRSALLERDLRDLERCAFYAGRKLPAAVRAGFDASEQRLNDAFLTYTRALHADAQALDPAFAGAADRLQASLDQLAANIAQQREVLTPPEPAVLPPRLGRQDRSIRALEPDGKMNRLLFGAWSPTHFVELEQERFNFEFHSSAPGAPKVHTETESDFSNVTEACDRLEERGFSGTFGYLMFGIHQYMYAPQWLLDKQRDEPDFFRVSQDGHRGESKGNRHCLNYFHPAVRQHIETYLGQYAAFCRTEPRVLFHEVAQEAYPHFSTSNGVRLTSYGPHMTNEFRAYLSGKYASIEALNRAWASEYAAFDAIEPPPDPNVERWDPPTPLTAEFANFAEQAYLDYLQRIYQALKAGDPSRPVVARHSSLLRRINGARIMETCDVLSAHARAPLMNVKSIYLNSINRFYKRGLGYMEDFWGVQEERDRAHDERAQRRGLEKHVAREGIWGRTLQMKWYAYTSGAYMFTYNGNWFNVRTDLTTWRYCAPALAVAKTKLETLDWMLTHSRMAPFRLLVLQPSASMRNEAPSNPPFGDILALHGMLVPNGLFYDLLPEEFVADERCRLEDYAAIVLPQTKYLSSGLQERLAAFVENGGLLVALGQPGVCDELARPSGLLVRRLRSLAGPEWTPAEALWAAEQDANPGPGAEFATVSCGRGRLVAAKALNDVQATAPAARFLALLTAAVPRDAWAENSRFEVLIRIAEDGGRYLCLLNADVDRAAEDIVWVNGPLETACDVTVPGGYPVAHTIERGRSRLAVRLGPGELAVLYLGNNPWD